MEEPGSSGESQKNRPISVNRGISTAGIALILASVAIAGLLPLTFLTIAVAIAVFGTGCVILWFCIIHPAILTGEERIKRIDREIEKVRDRVGSRKK